MTTKNKKVAILGKMPTKFNAPFDDLDWDIWTLNRHFDADKLKRITLWFDIHANNPNPKADITRANYPFKEAEELVGGQYFNNSIAYMIAYAILKGYKTIGLYGMRFNAEFETQRNGEYQNVRELIFFARAKGIEVIAPFDTDMLIEYPLYGV